MDCKLVAQQNSYFPYFIACLSVVKVKCLEMEVVLRKLRTQCSRSAPPRVQYEKQVSPGVCCG